MNEPIKPRSAIQLQQVKSSQIFAIGYDADTNTLAIQFAGRREAGSIGATYHYANVTPEQWEAFRNAESKGSWFGANLKHNAAAHPYVKVTEAQAGAEIPGNPE